jgi:hypothetical protein
MNIICQSLYYQYNLDKFHFFKSPKTFRVIVYNYGLHEKLIIISIIIKLRKGSDRGKITLSRFNNYRYQLLMKDITVLL